jgi:beta-hydroxylase
MISHAFAPRFILFYLFVLSAFVHFHGRIRHRFTRQLTGHSTILAPLNALLYAFSAVPNQPLLDVHRFPELDCLRKNWQTIRDESIKYVLIGGLFCWIFLS